MLWDEVFGERRCSLATAMPWVRMIHKRLFIRWKKFEERRRRRGLVRMWNPPIPKVGKAKRRGGCGRGAAAVGARPDLPVGGRRWWGRPPHEGVHKGRLHNAGQPESGVASEGRGIAIDAGRRGRRRGSWP